MKKRSLILAIACAFLIFGCGSKKEKVTEKNKGQIVEVDNTNEDYELYKNTTVDSVDKTNVNETKDSLAVKKDSVVEKKEVKVVKEEPVLAENEDGSLKKVTTAEINKQKKRQKKFYIVAGSFKEMDNAINMRKYFKSKGYTSMILYPFNNLNRVATGSYTARKAADKEIKKIRSMNLHYDGDKIEYWILWR